MQTRLRTSIEGGAIEISDSFDVDEAARNASFLSSAGARIEAETLPD